MALNFQASKFTKSIKNKINCFFFSYSRVNLILLNLEIARIASIFCFLSYINPLE